VNVAGVDSVVSRRPAEVRCIKSLAGEWQGPSDDAVLSAQGGEASLKPLDLRRFGAH
jgi:hypothetical protein